MTRREENHMFNLLEHIRTETHENNIMLKQICKVVNTYLSNHHQENEDDFNRNVLANLISNIVENKTFKR